MIIWDIATEKSLNSYRNHTDYVRAGAINPASENVILSGGYDSENPIIPSPFDFTLKLLILDLIKMYDVRSNKEIMSLDHGSPLESLVFLPSGGIFLSAGGNDIKVWDAIAGGRQLMKISHHTKTVTSLCLSSDGRHLISGSLDRQVKFCNTTNYQLIHTMNYTNSVLSVGISKDSNTLVVGQVDGTLGIHTREQKSRDEKVEKVREKRRKQRNFREADEFIEKFKPERQAKYDRMLRKFEYSQALDSVLTRQCISMTPQVTVAGKFGLIPLKCLLTFLFNLLVMQELLRRQGLVSAFTNQSQDSLAKILTFFNKYISDGRFSRVLIDIVNVFIDVHEKSFLSLSTDVQKLIIELSRRIRVEEELTIEFLKLQGQLDMVMSAALGVQDDREVEAAPNKSKMIQSENAQRAAVIKL